MNKLTLDQAISIFEKKLSDSDFIDSVHKIKIMTTIGMLKKLKDGIN